MEFRHLEAFVAAAGTGSFTRAGERLCLSQSAISQLVRSLEKDLGRTLFSRTNREVRLTSAGQDLLPEAMEILRRRQLLLDQNFAQANEVSGRLRVGTSAAATVHLWAAIYQEFAMRHPNVELDIRTMQRTQDTIDAVLRGTLDVGFAPLPLTSPKVAQADLGVQRAVLVTGSEHPLAMRARVLPQDLEQEAFILYQMQISLRDLSDQFFWRERITPRVVLESNDTHLIKAMVEVGFGIAFLPDWSITREVEAGQLRIVDLPGTPLAQRFGLIHLKPCPSPVALAFARFCSTNRHLLPEVARDAT